MTGPLNCTLIFAFAVVATGVARGAPQTMRIEETGITLVGVWASEGDAEYSGGTSVYANFDVFDPGAYAYFEFQGTGITWVGSRTFNAGLFDWIVDEGTVNERRDTVNTYIDGVDRSTTELLAEGLAPGNHTFKFISLGVNGGTMTSGVPSETYIDAFDITVAPQTMRIEETDITLVGAWVTEGDAEYSGGTSVYANADVFDPGAYAFFEFEGTGITWIGARTFNGGLFDWVVDEGTESEQRDTVSTHIDGVDRSTTELLTDSLAPGKHTFKFISLGVNGGTMTSGLPSETYIDAFDITLAPIPEPATLLSFALGAIFLMALDRHGLRRRWLMNLCRDFRHLPVE